jgi:hypothetical protein
MMTRSHMVSAVMVIIGSCAIGTGTILVYNSLHPYSEFNASLVLGSAEMVMGVLAIGQVCRSFVARLRRSVFTKKRVMILVATVVILSSCWTIKERSSRFRETSLLHSDLEQSILDTLTAIRKGELTKICISQEDGSPALKSAEGFVPIYQRSAAYHAAMRSKYERAARYPWFPVASDPPEPK